MTARLGLVALGILAALGLAEGVLRLAAALDPRVRLLATGRAARPAVTYATLEEFVASQAAHITPHKPWYNHWSNAFGFHDEEFVEPKPAGRRRVLVVGDSFTFALVPYPQGVMTLTEVALRAATVARLGASLRYRGLSSAEIDPDLPNTLLREFARARGIPLVDLTPAFVAESSARPELLDTQNDIHWTPRGNRVAARSLTAFLAPLVCAHR